MSILTGLEPAPDFPKKDLTDTNATFIELILGNVELVEQGHIGAERTSWVFRAGHPALRLASRRLLADTTRAEAFDHGVRTFETISMLVQSVPEHCDMFTVNANVVALANAFSDTKLLGYIDDAHHQFGDELPLTAAIVLESSERFYPSVARYAVYGAATARQFELDGVA